MAKLTLRKGAGAPAQATAAPAQPRARTPAATPETAAVVDPNAFVDGRGRLIKLRVLTALQHMRLLRDVGDENESYFSFCTEIARVSEIDGRGFAFPESRMDLEFVVQTLEVDGVSALRAHIHRSNTAGSAGDAQQ